MFRPQRHLPSALPIVTERPPLGMPGERQHHTEDVTTEEFLQIYANFEKACEKTAPLISVLM